MQEKVLSRRCLIFINDRLYFRCHSGLFSEDTIWDQHPTQLCPEDVMASGTRTDFLPAHIPDPITAYYSQLLRYTSRHLTKPDHDAIRALSGILSRLAVCANSGLLCGLLTSAFDICLLFWHPHMGQGDARRRRSFPSWCWAGWSGLAVLLAPEKKSAPGGDPKSWLLTCTEDIAYYVYDPSSSSSFAGEEAEPARSPVHRVWGPDDQIRLVADQWGFGRRLSDEDDASPPGHELVNWRAIPRTYPLLYLRARATSCFEMRLSKFGNVIVWPRASATSDAGAQNDPSSASSLAVGNFVPSDVPLFSEELHSGQEFEIVLLSTAEEYESFLLEWLTVGEVDARDEMEAGLKVKPDRPFLWALLVVCEEAPFADQDGREGIQAFYERRAMGFVYRDRVEEFEGLRVREVVLA
jgi:hypothetical protein